MLRVYPESWIVALLNFERKSIILFEAFSPEEYSQDQREQALRDFRATLQMLAQRTESIPLSFSLQAQLKRLIEFCDSRDENDHPHLLVDRANELSQNITNEIHAYLFLAVPAERRELFQNSDAWFGGSVLDSFPQAEHDIRGACQCYVLSQWTASVFHCMRVLEIGLRKLARKLRVKPRAPIDYAQWGDLISAINDEIKARKSPPKKLTSAQRKNNQWYSEMATNFSHVNAAWRTHASHARVNYDEQAAEAVLMHVRSFMRVLARGLS